MHIVLRWCRLGGAQCSPIIDRARLKLDRLGRLKWHLLCMIVKYFLSVRTGIRAHQVDPGDFNHAQRIKKLEYEEANCAIKIWPCIQKCHIYFMQGQINKRELSLCF